MHGSERVLPMDLLHFLSNGLLSLIGGELINILKKRSQKIKFDARIS
jgi:hypothetical protein